MRKIVDGLLKEAFIRLSKEKGKLELTAKGPIAVLGVILLAATLVVLFGDKIVPLLFR